MASASASITGLQPFNVIRCCLTMAVLVATLVIAKLIDGYVFCGFNANFLVDLPLGIALICACFVCSLLGLAVNRKPTTKCGRCLRMFAGTTIGACLFLTCYASFLIATLFPILGNNDRDLDPFNICGNRNVKAVKAEFSNLAPIFELVQRIDFVLKLLISAGWIVPVVFFYMIVGACVIDKRDRVRQEVKDNDGSEAGKKRTYLEHFIIHGFESLRKKTINEASDQSAAIDVDFESAPSDAIPEIGTQKTRSEVETEKGTASSDDGSNEAKPQFDKALPELSIVDEEEETTAAKEGGK